MRISILEVTIKLLFVGLKPDLGVCVCVCGGGVLGIMQHPTHSSKNVHILYKILCDILC